MISEHKFRKNASFGEWYSILLPFCLFSLTCNYHKASYFLLFIICGWFCMFDFLRRRIFEKSHYSFYTFSIASIPVSIFIWKFSFHSKCFFHVFALCYLSIWCYTYLRYNLLKYCPGSFTFGEAEILTQSVIVFLIGCEISMFLKGNISDQILDVEQIPNHIKCSQILLFGILLLLYILNVFPALQEQIPFIGSLFVTAFTLLIVLHICLGQNFVSWLLSFSLRDKKRVYIILFWLLCSCVAVTCVCLVNLFSSTKGSTIIRKIFHFLITIVYITGIFMDLELLRLASVIVLVILIMLEVFRILKVPVIGSGIENAFQIFLDDKDTGVLILTHIYLLLGCSCPLWLRSYSIDMEGTHISLFSGILSIGIGDTTAAICGKLFGRHKWKGTNKTHEGSFCSLVLQLMCAFYFFHISHIFTYYNATLLVSAVCITTYLEAKTDQVDNLMLPLCMFSILVWIQ